MWKKEVAVNPLFVWYGINLNSFRREISKISTGTSGSMKNISKVKFLQLDFFQPPIKLQNKFADIVRQTEKLKAKYKESETELDNLFGSLMQRAFKGEL